MEDILLTSIKHKRFDSSYSQTAAVFLDNLLTSSSGSKVMVSMSTGDSSLPLMRTRTNQITNMFASR